MEYEGYVFSRDKNLMAVDRVKELLAQSYWAADRSRERIAVSLEHSLCYGVFRDGCLVGFARVVTDHATVYWLADVIVDERHRGRGLGKKLLEFILETGEFAGARGILRTRDAHGLYTKYGFVTDCGRFMLRAAE